MRAMLHERLLDLDTSPQISPVTVLFFGCRSKSQDDLFGEEWRSSTIGISFQSGVSVVTAYSRDQSHKIYVTHKLKEFSAQVWDVINRGGFIFLSGSAKRMPQDVKRTLVAIVMENTGTTDLEAAKYVANLEKQGRYVAEVWS